MAAFADGEAQSFFHGYRGYQLHGHLGVVAGHDHFHAGLQLNAAGHVGGPEVELGLVAFEDGVCRPPSSLVRM